jgi:small nuclear ribonucleoprotein (snRNP)-like protein
MGAQSWCISIIFSIRKLWSLNRIQGVLAGFDQKSNIVLADSKERVYSIDEGVEEIPLGLYLVKGEMMFVPTLFDLRIRVELT